MRTLYLPLKKQWYEMIERGEKLEEYREFSRHWISRLMEWHYRDHWKGVVTKKIREFYAAKISYSYGDFKDKVRCKEYDAVCFSYGYTKRRMTFECAGIRIGSGRPEWGAPEDEVFIIKLGKRIS